MPHPSITAVVEVDDILRCDPGPLIRFIHSGRHIWSPIPGRIALWRDDIDDDQGTPSFTPAILEYWAAALRAAPHLPYAIVPGGRCALELFAAGCGSGAIRSADGIVTVDQISGLMTLDQWARVIRGTGAEHHVHPDAVATHVDALGAFLRYALDWD